ncbi:hypothetical protein DSL32_12230, partial [Mycobacterium tuberculosis]
QVVLNHGGLLRIEDTDPGGQPPGTSIYVLLPLSITWGSRLLRRWRIPWVIRHVARLLFLY